MSAFPSYATGTVSVAAGGTVIVGAGTIWSDVNARAGDDIVIAGHTVIVEDVTVPTHLVIDAWPYADVPPGSAYKIVQRSPLRYAGGQAMADVSALVAALNTDGFYVFVASTLSAPDPYYGNENQFAFQASTGKLWRKTSGLWVFQGIYKGFNIRGAYDNAATYALGDVVASAGASYVRSNPTSASGHAPPGPTFWHLLAAKGDIGLTGPQGAGYGGTSPTSLAIGSGAKAFTTQVGLAYQACARVRATSTADATKWMEGVATYAGTTLTITVDKVNGSGTFASWNFNIVGQPGTGDLTAANNLSDVASADTAITNLHGVSYNAPQTIEAAAQSVARANISAVKVPSSWTRTVLTSGSGTYTTPAGCKAINVRLVGGGAGGGGGNNGSGGTQGSNGSATTFGTSLLTAAGGLGGGSGGAAGGSPGGASGGDINVAGQYGGPSTGAGIGNVPSPFGIAYGGGSIFGGGGFG